MMRWGAGPGTAAGTMVAAAVVATVSAAATLLARTPAAAQSAADARQGLTIARAICAGCHAVERGNRRSINPDAPAFSTIAAAPAMSGPALHALLQTSHRRMPDIVLPPADRAAIVAYILGLKDE